VGTLALVLIAGFSNAAFASEVPPVDTDLDTVPDGIDLCPNTPFGATVDGDGCPTDSDLDGVYDGIDQCVNTTPKVTVDEFGCKITLVAGELLSLDSSALVISGLTSGPIWMISILAGIAGTGIYLAKLRYNRD